MRKAAPAVVISLLLPLLAFAQRRSPERRITDRPSQLNTDQQTALYQNQAAAQPASAHCQTLVAAAYIQKVRESTDFAYLDRAAKILDSVLGADAGNYEAMRLRSEVEMERHHFVQVREYSEELTKITPEDPWNWGTLGDSLMELGEYDQAGKAYERMLALNPNQASYNRLAYHRFVTGNANEAIRLMTLAAGAGSWAPENTAWCLVELGNMYFKTGQLDAAERAYSNALALFHGSDTAHAGLRRLEAEQANDAQATANDKRKQASVTWPDHPASLSTLYLHSGKTAALR